MARQHMEWHCPSVLSAWAFSWNWIISFLKFWYGARKPFSVTEPDFLEKILLPQRLGNGAKKILFFWIYQTIWSWNLTEYVLEGELILLPVFQHKCCMWENSSSRDIGQNALCHSYCRILDQLYLQSKSMK